MLQTLVSTKYQVVIPKSIRRRIGIKPGHKLDVDLVGNRITLSPSQKLSWPQDYYPLVKGLWKPGEAEKYLENERSSWDD
ncbi:hypothetical protein A2634_02440 [Candidatus Amesbacteria bacterium RIFCSPHIGHO2_01_FULL_48_32]|uniref:SpoVT-AbrB domain-containing protein n=1 Tax=Candidatus Amesbacteria bacterium RIFCSPLOWO2_01_FULL_48_25 TaxID=1797259 RepID=A0A1F4ZDS0_9BACT|nr:MAG: hypothetical protein A2634_02440 [Candidatus Amesbacteria bacterium RIFCSPHIGHO2_01_FULL_48_32]OGD04441.1 MAG: hypothetical protein A2989_05435 [Candidatus Amesbacteria bacterium RIFCSPLOWO2_01_FULL_48_25]HJZ06286.1 AbrB/MazE/SpoVT family DNA-binding domain-containing protein [Patescibacteria group bacterium]